MAATNAFDTDAAVALFAPNAVIDDPSTGETFDGQHGVREVTPLDDDRSRARVDFTGDFGHEIGRLDLAVDDDGRIVRIDADLE
ncbi:nuclear transport factor 2 family protein [Devosia salina]|uniref:Nuclear transport factor 2 family protein n=1 Tax=Devosia salina TaxID=2860336 RepID=A0ABX8WFW9_9HYPH|nr:nuclear transport factor 2 family protein [Devosia salina]QYO75185.1 nuclear transport factor 2 family protein [Devosia salina]